MAISELTGFLKYKDENGNIQILRSIVDADDVVYKDGKLTDFLPEYLTQAKYDELDAKHEIIATKPYFIYEEDVDL